jgi:hypothetical protein
MVPNTISSAQKTGGILLEKKLGIENLEFWTYEKRFLQQLRQGAVGAVEGRLSLRLAHWAHHRPLLGGGGGLRAHRHSGHNHQHGEFHTATKSKIFNFS